MEHRRHQIRGNTRGRRDDEPGSKGVAQRTTLDGLICVKVRLVLHAARQTYMADSRMLSFIIPQLTSIQSFTLHTVWSPACSLLSTEKGDCLIYDPHPSSKVKK